MLFFIVMMWCLQPFGWQAFAVSEKRFFILDSAKGLYSPSAYFVAYVLSSTFLAWDQWMTCCSCIPRLLWHCVLNLIMQAMPRA